MAEIDTTALPKKSSHIPSWLDVQYNETGEISKTTVNVERLAEFVAKETHFYTDNNNLAGYLFNGQYWKRYKNVKQADNALSSRVATLLKQNKKLTSAKQVKNIVDLIRVITVKDVADYIDFTDKPYMVSFTNGTLDMRTLEIKPNAPQYHALGGLDYPVSDKDLPTPKTDEFFTRLLGDENAELLYKFIGYGFKRNYLPFQNFVILYGKGGNGKGTALTYIGQKLYSGNVSELSLQAFGDKFKTVGLVGKYANIGSDIPANYMPNTENLKLAVSGKEKFEVESKGVQAFSIVNYATLFFSANDLPNIRRDSGLDRRPLVLTTQGKGFTNADGKSDLFDESELLDERPAFTRKVIKMFMDAERARTLNIPENVQKATADWLKSADIVSQWLDEHTEEEKDRRPTAKYMYQQFSRDIEEMGMQETINRNTFYSRMENLGVKSSKSVTISSLDDEHGKSTKRFLDIKYVD
ncbi:MULTISPECIES: DNA primase family protein [Leuconostoc]|uniref:DNA primase family protein n=1 Tax=Leuconostoc TaxID=1243 RepID=UPI000273850C|nr:MULTISPECIES: phage/plasmid primase, P4 family [Leuconostoc]KDA48608.1 Phage DNA primase [Leuconostoc pseudomesenteroides 1159]KDA50341.1 Phage DNA primase [Leuconostoc pseudomesenteroides PS12]OQJ68120.1 DNA primase [Leuconostoc pseudomesenteroides]CCJ67379.1 Phage DNA primase [Leuconostoc pseudomesenteroides 4882]MDG9743856.1 phage/plasmid primase, P4 family [Leuconostoc falkenbergense]